MRIYRMTATFGKLEHETLTLEPGLNVITAPNEWGKSTWCAFLVAMLYGLDTRVKSTQTALADKEHYAPWSGSPMAGRIDLNWNGRDITIERKSKRRVPLGEFQAYETESGLPVTELTAANCGQMLLGVEQSVFRRAGFIRHSDLPVKQDDALRRRLNALVTTGDESGAADRLAATLRDLKNRCRYNRSGLLPQAEAEKQALQTTIAEVEALEEQSKKMNLRLEEVRSWISQLGNHRQALEYAAAQELAAKVAQAKEALTAAEETRTQREAVCEKLPPKAEGERMVQELRSFREQWAAVQAEQQALPQEPVEPQQVPPFVGMEKEAALEMARNDAKTFTAITGTRGPAILIVMGVLGLAAAAGLVYLLAYLYAGIAGGAALIALIWGIFEKVSIRKKTRALLEKYGSPNVKKWPAPVYEHEKAMRQYQAELKHFRELPEDVEVRMMVLRKKRESLCADKDPQQQQEYWQQVCQSWEDFHRAEREESQARRHFDTLNAMVKPVTAPTMPDNLTHSAAETARLLTECAVEEQRMQNRLGQYQGRMETLGDKAQLNKQLDRIKRRIGKLEDTYIALTIAQDTLAQAKAELQRRFAPRITKRAQKLLSDMTGGRYSSVIMADDFSLQVRGSAEETHRSALWRSDGTIDQLYLALRLAVAEELTPNAPLVLDDALVRFDDNRMKAAVNILKEMSRSKQIICFTCQGREEDV